MADPVREVRDSSSEADINQVNQWMRSQPWWSQFIRAQGQDPNNVHLSKSQRQQLISIAQANGVQVDMGDDEIDDAGNFNQKGNGWKKAAIALGIGGLAVTGLGAAGIGPLAGAFGGGAGAAGAAGAAASAAPEIAISSTPLSMAAPGVVGAVTGGGGAAATGAGVSGSILSRVGGALKSKDFLTGAADVLGGAAKNAAATNAANDRNALALYNDGEQNKLARDKFALTAPGTRLAQSTRASILSRVQPTTISWGGPGSGLRGEVPTTTGGFRSALSDMDPMTKELANTIMAQNLANQQANQDSVTVTPPKLGKSSILDKIIGGGALAASAGNVLRRVM